MDQNDKNKVIAQVTQEMREFVDAEEVVELDQLQEWADRLAGLI